MRIGVDMDDVLVETMPAYLRAFEERFGRAVPLAQASWDPFEAHPDIPSAERLAFFDHLRGTRFMFTRPARPDAPPAVRALAAAGHTLIVVSGRPQPHLADTEAMLERMGIRDCFAAIVHRQGETIPEFKGRAAREQRLDVLVEDELPAARAVAAAGVPVLLMDRAWNQGILPPGIVRIASWGEALARLTDGGLARLADGGLARLRDWAPPPAPAPPRRG
jgi:phosphoglycolate phosphatase-like HAD superfamily hydrolase